ncbi:hypothetical protein [Pontibacter chitinilyticus]|uniref:hypothetical protein n=1 Tax=Pontibacter chitinilyticus TaxID=2674989 RepID=UPI00321AE092
MSFVIIAFSLPIIPLNPIGSLPIISTMVILATIAITRKQWAQKREVITGNIVVTGA